MATLVLQAYGNAGSRGLRSWVPIAVPWPRMPSFSCPCNLDLSCSKPWDDIGEIKHGPKP